MKPITPDEVVNKKKKLVPDYVIECFNAAIAKNWDGHSSTVFQDAIVSAICLAGDINRRVVFDQHYLDIEPIYADAGWKVEYDKPGYCETYEAKFIFTKKKNK